MTPLIRVSLILITGISSGLYFPGYFLPPLLPAFFSVSFFSLWALRRRVRLLAYIALFSLGLFYGRVRQYSLPASGFSGQSRATVTGVYQGTVEARLEEDIRTKVMFPEPGIDLRPGDRVLLTGSFRVPSRPFNPGVFDRRSYLAHKGIGLLGDIEELRLLKRPFSIKGLAFAAGRVVEERVCRYMPSGMSGVFLGMFLGRRASFPEEEAESFVQSGAVHVLAVSGLHVGLVFIIFFMLFRSVGIRRNRALFISLLFVFFYAALTGARPSSVRACVMLTFAVTAVILERDIMLFNSLFCALLVLIVKDPHLIEDIGFQLSFSATFGILCMNTVMARAAFFQRLRGPVKWAAGSLMVSLGAQFAVYPFLAFHFNRVSLIAPVTNLFVLPLVAAIIALGFVILAFSLVSPFTASVFSWACVMVMEIMLWVIRSLASFPLSDIWIARPGLYVVLLYAGILVLFLPQARRRRRSLIRLWAVAVSVFLLCRVLAPGKLVITFLHMGQADCIHVQLPGREHILIDAGGSMSASDPGIETVAPYLFSRGVRRLEHIFLTNQGYNHCLGIKAVLERFPVGGVYFSGRPYTSCFEEARETAYSRSVPVSEVSYGDRFLLGGAVIEIWSPQEELSEESDDSSMVIRLRYGDFSCLIMSEAGFFVQEALMEEDIMSTVVQLPGHGDIPVSARLMDKLAPDVAVVTGSSLSEHNSSLLGSLSIPCLITGVKGAVQVVSDGKGYRVSTYR